MLVKIKKTFRYADPRGPHLPQIDFVKGEVVDVSEELAKSIISNGHGVPVEEFPESASVQVESKEDGLVVDSKDDSSSAVYDALPPKKQRFVDEYLVDSDATAAAIRAGYAENNAENMGAKLLDSEDVRAAIAEKGEQ